jgi:flagellar hook protein FlgE
MANSLFTGVSGLLAHQRRLDIVANNLANLNTTSYKSNRGNFTDLFYESISQASQGNGVNVGGTNPVQMGTGVRVSEIKKLFSQGNLETTGQPLDFALDGEGFFVLATGEQTVYSRAGAFSLDADNYLVDASTGAYVQRFGTLGDQTGDVTSSTFQVPGDQRIRVPIGSVVPGQESENISLEGILNSEAIGPLSQILKTAFPFMTGGVAATPATLINSLDTVVTPYGPGDTIEISGTQVDGSPVSTTLAVDATTTLGDLVTAVSNLFPNATSTMNAEGDLLLTSDLPTVSLLSLSMADSVGNAGEVDWDDHRAVQTQLGKDGDVFSGVFEMFDTQGGAHELSFEFTKQDVNTWDLELSMDPAEGSITGGVFSNLLFNDDGSLHSSVDTDQEISFSIVGISNPQSCNFSFEDIRQLATDFEVLPTQDGFAPSDMISTVVDADGVLQGITSNGQSLKMARLAIATFTNVQGLSAIGGSYYTNTLNSGIAQIGAALTGGRASVHGGQLESSNVDTAYEFTQLIVAQRGFSANARTISVADEVLEELTNIIR